jgi:hypothetical protein
MSSKSLIIKTYEHDGLSVDVPFTHTAFFNATKVAQAFDKRAPDWLVLDSTKEYVEAITRKLVLEQNQLVTVKHGGDNPGTWLHPKLGVAFARWCNVDFSVWCDEMIASILQGDVIPVRASDALILSYRRADVVLNSHLKAAKRLGTDAPMARAIAVDVVKKLTGVDFQPLLAGNVIDDKPMTPTELGKPLGWSGKNTNTKLEIAGLQTRNEDHEWVPTDKGKPYCTVNPYKAPHSDHAGYRVLWYRAVLSLIPDAQQEAA